ncbi:hypothetical protein [Alteromonas macleodii]|uniref:hypothetical protein n=1 Tax=Alteromonas macleodii TaxID=28108 RepID=UPI003BF7F229
MKLQLLGSSASELFSLISEHLISNHVEFALSELSNLDNRDQRTDGIIVCDPIEYLKHIFVSIEHSYTNIGDFFEANIDNVNAYYEKIFGCIKGNKALVLSDSDLLISVLIIEFKYNVSFSKIPYGKLFSIASDESVSLVEKEKLYITKRLREAYLIYEKVNAIFLDEWNSVVQQVIDKFKTNKNIAIHVGPPKTGTSAIQGWLNSQSDNLSSKGIYYPNHKTDRNGISSGNFSSLISTSNGRSLYFDREKLSQLIEELEKRNEKMLLLSSEHFYYFLPWLFLYCKSAKYIFYIRHPLSVLESGYNQQVKRHGKTEKFRAPSKVKFNHLETIVTIASKFQVDVMYRFYDFNDSKGDNIFKDFSSCFDNFIEAPAEFRKINTKFSPGSLELMRLSNGIASKAVLEELDLILQRMSESHVDFSLMNYSHFEKLNNFLEQDKDELVARADTLDSGRFSRLLTSYKCAETLDTDALNDDFRSVIKSLCRNHKLIAYYLHYQSYNSQNVKLYSSLSEHLTSKVLSVVAFYSLPKIIRLKKAIQRF